MAEITRHIHHVKTALKKSNLSGTFIGAKYRFSPYMACEHGCLYCDGRAEKYYVDGEFDRDIVIRPNLPDLLRGELPRLREKGVVSIGSGVSDAYQPVEKTERLMRRCAEALADHAFPVAVLTKSALIQRDIDIWQRVNSQAGFTLVVSLTYADDQFRRIFEPRAASVEQRLSLLQAFRAAGCHTGVLAMPVLPFLSDTPENLTPLYRRLAEIGVDFIMPGSLTLRPGRQKDVYMRVIGDRFPDLLPAYRALYREDRASGVSVLAYRRNLRRLFGKLHRQTSISPLVPHYMYRDKVQLYDELNILLHHMTELYSDRGVDVAPLRRSLDRYMTWLTERKRIYNRRPSWDYAHLEDELRELQAGGRLENLLQNDRLSAFMREIISERRVFDYTSLKTH